MYWRGHSSSVALGPQRVQPNGQLKEGAMDYLREISPINNPILSAPLLMIQGINDAYIPNFHFDDFHEAVLTNNLGLKGYAYGKANIGHGIPNAENHKIFWAMETFMKLYVETGIDVEPLTQDEHAVR